MAQILTVLQLAVLLLTGLQANPSVTVEQKAQALQFAIQATEIAQSYVVKNGANLLKSAQDSLATPSPEILGSATPQPSPIPVQSSSYSAEWEDEICDIESVKSNPALSLSDKAIGYRILNITGNVNTVLVWVDGDSHRNRRYYSNGSGLPPIVAVPKGTYTYTIRFYDSNSQYISLGRAKLLFEKSGTVVFNCE